MINRISRKLKLNKKEQSVKNKFYVLFIVLFFTYIMKKIRAHFETSLSKNSDLMIGN